MIDYMALAQQPDNTRPTFEISDRENDDLLKLEKNVNHIEATAENFAVANRNSAKTALEMACQSRKLGKRLEELRKEIVRPHIDFQKALKKLVDGYTDKLESIEGSLVKKLSDYRKNSDDFSKLESDEGNLSIDTTFDFKISDPSSIPAEYLTVDKKAIEGAIKRGIRNIAGVEVIESEKISLRTKN